LPDWGERSDRQADGSIPSSSTILIHLPDWGERSNRQADGRNRLVPSSIPFSSTI
jgi:hypothetical protein